MDTVDNLARGVSHMSIENQDPPSTQGRRSGQTTKSLDIPTTDQMGMHQSSSSKPSDVAPNLASLDSPPLSGRCNHPDLQPSHLKNLSWALGSVALIMNDVENSLRRDIVGQQGDEIDHGNVPHDSVEYFIIHEARMLRAERRRAMELVRRVGNTLGLGLSALKDIAAMSESMEGEEGDCVDELDGIMNAMGLLETCQSMPAVVISRLEDITQALGRELGFGGMGSMY